MLVPLAVLAVGAVLAGMVWHKQFFGEHDKMAAFFAMGHGEAAAHGTEGGAEAGHATEAAADAAHGTEAAADTGHATTEPAATADTAHATEAAVEPAATEGEGHADAGAAHAAPEGAIYMSEASNAVLDLAHHAPVWVKVSPFVAMLVGFFVALQFYIRDPSLPGRVAAANPVMYRFLLNKWYFDEVYDTVFVRPALWLGGFFWKRGDGAVIDGSINGVAMGIIPYFTRLAGRAQSGYLFHYAFAMVIGIALLITWMTLSGGAE
jgi:NADH-quinone oxidoreductase subunit L